MALTSEFTPLELDQLRREAAVLKADGWRFIETHAANGDEGVDLYYSFMKNGHIVNYRIAGVLKDTPVPSITDLFLAAFVFENEARELFGVDMRDIAIDFQGAMYAPAMSEPMTFITPEQKAAKEKAAKAAAAKAAKEAGGEATTISSSASANTVSNGRVFVMTPERKARLDAKMATMSPEKVAKVEAALKAREAEADAAKAEPKDAPAAAPAKPEPAQETLAHDEVLVGDSTHTDAILEEKIAALSPDKAAKVRAALEGKRAEGAETIDSPDERIDDPQLEQLIGMMDDAKAATVRAALARKGGE